MFLCKFDGYNYEQVCDDFEDLQRFEDESLIDFTIRFCLNCLKFKNEEKTMDEELLDFYEHIFSLPPIHNPCESISIFSQTPSNYINTIENSSMKMQINNDEVASIMYDQFLHLVYTFYSIDSNQDSPSHVSESQSQSLENFTIQVQEDTSNNLEEDTTLKSEN